MRETVTLTKADAGRAGILLAARHTAERRSFPLLPRAYEDPDLAARLARQTLAFSDGVGVVDDHGDLVGFLTAFDSTPDPSSPMARYTPERSMLGLVHGHAVAPGIEPFPVYAQLFASLAAPALDRGITDHVVHLPIGDPAVEAAWAALGFGRSNVVAIRDLTPLIRARSPDVDVRVATPDDLDIVDRLVDEECVFHAASPIFRPYLRAETFDAVRAELATELASDDHACLIARRAGADIGIISVGPGRGSPLYVPEASVYIAATAVLPAERGSGAGGALVDAALAWARDRGHRAACLHFATSNATSTAFWTGLGFVPVMAHLRRLLDPRILSSRPPD